MHSELIHRLMHKGIYSHPSRTLHNQKQPTLFGIYTFNAYLCKDHLCRDCHRSSKESTMRIVLWCNGSTTGFGSVCPGSNPGRTTQKSAYADFFYYITNQDKTPFIIAKTKCTTFQNEMYIFLIFSHLAKTIFERLLITV